MRAAAEDVVAEEAHRVVAPVAALVVVALRAPFVEDAAVADQRRTQRSVSDAFVSNINEAHFPLLGI